MSVIVLLFLQETPSYLKTSQKQLILCYQINNCMKTYALKVLKE